MKRVVNALLTLVLAALIYNLYQLYGYNDYLQKSFSVLSDKLSRFKKENLELKADLDYFSEPKNLAKELRSRFNYKKPDEKLIIVVPPKGGE